MVSIQRIPPLWLSSTLYYGLIRKQSSSRLLVSPNRPRCSAQTCQPAVLRTTFRWYTSKRPGLKTPYNLPLLDANIPGESSAAEPFFRSWPGNERRRMQEDGLDDASEDAEAWSDEEEAYNATEVDLEDETTVDPGAGIGYRKPLARQKLSDILARFSPSNVSRGKTDLSYINTVMWENGQAKPMDLEQTGSFRGTRLLRRVMLNYLRLVEPLLSDPSSSELAIDRSLRRTFTSRHLACLSEHNYDVSDVGCWSWIFLSPSAEVAVSRYITISQELREFGGNRRLPKFIILQILRSSDLSAYALQQILGELLAELEICEQRADYSDWDWTSRVCLIVRLLRHARQTSTDGFEHVVAIAKHIFSNIYQVQTVDLGRNELQKLSHIFNRFLSLLALPPTKRPFSSSLSQQNAQLALIRLMTTFQPKLPLTREGYRALIKVQLVRAKTGEEHAWAGAKSTSWPPWRQDRLGIEEDIEYSGKESRAMRLLRRMLEAGYTHGPWEKAAAVLAGWDTDKSPTIQTRSILRRAKQPWRGPESPESLAEDNEVWAARISATRTRLEAWASFCAYEKSMPPKTRRFQPYYAMLGKLMGKTAMPGSLLWLRNSPGDIKETFQEPINPNDMVYVEWEIPSIEGFYQQMLKAGIKPAGRLLRDLLNYAPDPQSGVRFIQESTWSEITVDVLLHAEKYPADVIKHRLGIVPEQTLAAFIGLLSRFGLETQPSLYLPTSGSATISNTELRSASGMLKQQATPVAYASELLEILEMRSTAVWNAFFQGLEYCISSTSNHRRDRNDRNDRVRGGLRALETAFVSGRSKFSKIEVQPDLDSFKHISFIVQKLLRDARSDMRMDQHVHFTGSVLRHAIYGKPIGKWPASGSTMRMLCMPEPEDILQHIRVLLSGGDITGLLKFLRWLSSVGDVLKQSNKLGDTGHGDDFDASTPGYNMAVCAIRLFMDESLAKLTEEVGWPFETPLQINEETQTEIKNVCKPLGWPTDAEVALFLSFEKNREWMGRVAHTIRIVMWKESRN